MSRDSFSKEILWALGGAVTIIAAIAAFCVALVLFEAFIDWTGIDQDFWAAWVGGAFVGFLFGLYFGERHSRRRRAS